MKRLIATLGITALIALTGCGDGTTGGPGAKDKDKGTHVTQPENSFKLSPPTLGTTIKQGEKTDVKIGVSRGKNFDQDVALSFKDVPQGVSITPAHPTLKASEKDVTVAVEAAKDATLGDFTINIVGKPAKEGPEATDSFKITVKKP
jgi:uncharacterized membrane protein